MNIRFLIKEIRKSKNLSLYQLALLSGISKTQLNDIENNIKIPTILTLECIALALKVNLKELYIIKR